MLSRGFVQIERRHSAILKRVKSLLPRRESERRVHPLFRHCDILSAVETRIRMLNMTYTKYIQSGMCCFTAGKVLDELDRVLKIVEEKGPPPGANEILQELRDISSMAMEYFDEKIIPTFRRTPTTSNAPARIRFVREGPSSCFQIVQIPIVPKPFTSAQYSPTTSTPKTPKVYFVQPGLQAEITKLTKIVRRQRTHINMMSKEIQKLYMRVQKQQTRIKAQTGVINEHTVKLQEQESKTNQQDTVIAEMKKTIGEWENKLVTLSNEVVTSRDDIIKAIFPVPIDMNQNQQPQTVQSQAQTHKTVIRPRVSQVQTPNSYIVELERKRKASVDGDIPNKLRFIMRQESAALTLKEKINNKINENITQNIATNLRNQVEDTTKKKYDITKLFSSSVDAILNTSFGATQAKKRRCDNDLLVNLH